MIRLIDIINRSECIFIDNKINKNITLGIKNYYYILFRQSIPLQFLITPYFGLQTKIKLIILLNFNFIIPRLIRLKWFYDGIKNK